MSLIFSKALTGAWSVPGGGIFQHTQNTFPINREGLTRPDLGRVDRHAVNLFGLGEALDASAEHKIRSLFVYNANPVIASADQGRVVANLCRSNLFTVVSEIFQTDTCD